MSQSEAVVRLDDYRRKTTGSVANPQPQEATDVNTAEQYVKISSINEPPLRQAARPSLEEAADLYPNLESGMLSRALHLLREADQLLNDAASSVTEDDMITADDAVQRFGSLLPELFACRSLGDSFGTVIVGLFYGLSNLAGIPVTSSQIGAFQKCVKWLRREPYLQYNSALNLVSELEECGLTIDPPGLAVIGDVLLG